MVNELPGERPWGLKWRSSVWFVTLVVGLGLMVDLLVYSLIIPVVPFRLQDIGFEDASSRTGWLLFAFSAGVVLSTPPIAFLAERYWNRTIPLVVGLLMLVGSQIMFMEAPSYWLMCLARVIQGVSSSVVWVVALALLCDTVPEEHVGRQIGLAGIGFSIGMVLGPPLGGVLFDRLGFRAPFILGIAFCLLDLVGRLLIIEKAQAIHWLAVDDNEQAKANTTPAVAVNEEGRQEDGVAEVSPASTALVTERKPQPSMLKIIRELIKSKKAVAAFFNTFAYGIAFTGMEPTLPLRLQELYGFGSLQTGLVFIAMVVPSFFSSPLAGWFSDKNGTAWTTVGCFLLAVPWWCVMAIKGSVALLVVGLALCSLFISGVIAPLTSDLAAAARGSPTIGYAHVFGAFNFAFSIASGVGPLVASQIYENVLHGWTVIMGICGGLTLLAAVVAFFGTGEETLAQKFTKQFKSRTGDAEEQLSEGGTNRDGPNTP